MLSALALNFAPLSLLALSLFQASLDNEIENTMSGRLYQKQSRLVLHRRVKWQTSLKS